MSEKQQQAVQEEDQQGAQGAQENNQQLQQVQRGSPAQQQSMAMSPRGEDYRPPATRESRIKDRPHRDTNDSIKIKIELDLEVEVRCPRHRCKKKIEVVVFGVDWCWGHGHLQVDLYARVKGDVTIGLMWWGYISWLRYVADCRCRDKQVRRLCKYKFLALGTWVSSFDDSDIYGICGVFSIWLCSCNCISRELWEESYGPNSNANPYYNSLGYIFICRHCYIQHKPKHVWGYSYFCSFTLVVLVLVGKSLAQV